ncbi:hypothetical protein SDRG_06343 [Saprolegnia diclina VS20]|uniref:E3 ubiquitin-protein ligase n=1 Tax=Saprolegnia diclina (strain VS20) TaxID=1156394 RepID=T0QNE2_SAPDV|nr:hypothetical protein SDRG_06343 [Saprolegnia diclina VS20]EQC36236.1 hypothetical protein SDRG_06343 [Saprolegnia diclina VS20]|eukprot:XP_008610342.1 hypothetical protein SDRG_06343 [Saprolegnia diclina VS20]
MAESQRKMTEVAEFAQLAFLSAVDNGEVDGQDIRKGLDILLTCMVDAGGKLKKVQAPTPQVIPLSALRKGNLVRPKTIKQVPAMNPILARLAAKKQRKVCGYIFKADEMAYSCRDCQHDSTCVMCQACFADSNHDGHDVSFQRTSAGGCCDCGDTEAWAKDGFCHKHPGRDSDVSKSKPLVLPKGMQEVASPLINTVVQYVHDVLVMAEDSVEITAVMRELCATIPPHDRASWKDSDDAREASNTKTRAERDAAPPATEYDVRLHSDDVHPFQDVVKAIRTHFNVSKSKAIGIANHSDAEGCSIVSTTNSLRYATHLVHAMEGYTLSVAPVRHSNHMRHLDDILEWLRQLCEVSDDLAQLVSQAIAAPRHAISPDQLVSTLSLDETLESFLRTHPVNAEAHAFFRTMFPMQTPLSTWIPPFDDQSLVATYLAEMAPHTAPMPPPRALTSTLTSLVRNYALLNKPASQKLNRLFHELILNQHLKHTMMDAFVSSYLHNTSSYLKGLGASSDSIFDFATQLLTVPSLLVPYMGGANSIVAILLSALASVLETSTKRVLLASGVVGTLFQPDNPAISHSKYKHAADNLEFALGNGTAADLICHSGHFQQWLHCLGLLQNSDAQIRRGRHEPHVEYESDSWFSTFNLGIKMHALFPLILQGLTATAVASVGTSLAELMAASVAEIKRVTLEQTVVHAKLLPGGTPGTDYNLRLEDANGVWRDAASLHIPLHRFVAAFLKHVLYVQKADRFDVSDWTALVGLDALSPDDVLLLLDAPLKCLVMSSQIQSNLWRRNGDENMITQLFNYSALPYCVNYRDSDLFLLQVGIALLGPEPMLQLLLDRFHLASFFHLAETTGLSATLAYDDDQNMHMVEELLRLLIVLATNVPSSTGAAFEEAFLSNELLHHLMVKFSSFSELSENMALPLGGQETISAARLEPVLSKLATFVPPNGMEPGKYELLPEFMAQCNPYHVHLNRELHEQARDRCASWRTSQPPNAPPLVLPPAPLPVFASVPHILTTPSTMKLLQQLLETMDATNVSETVVSMTLDVLVFGVQMAMRDSADDGFWRSLLPLVPTFLKCQQNADALDKEQHEVLEWIVTAIKAHSPLCAAALQQATPCEAAKAGASNELSLQERKEQAKQRAMAAMARQQAMFSQMMADDDEDAADDADDEMETDTAATMGDVAMGDESGAKKRSCPDASPESQHEKKAKVENCCILCHESSKPDEMGMVGFVHQSTVLSSTFRPHPDNALTPSARAARKDIGALIEHMKLVSYPEDGPALFAVRDHPAHGRRMAFADLFWDMEDDEEDDEEGEEGMRESDDMDGGRRPRAGTSDMESGGEGPPIGLPNDHASPALGPNLPVDGDAPVANALGGVIQQALRRIPVPRRRQYRFHTRSANSSASGLAFVPCGLFARTCQHTVHMRCLDTYIRTLHEKALRGEEFDGMQAVDGDANMTQFLCPLCKTLCNILLPVVAAEAPPPSRSLAPWHRIVDDTSRQWHRWFRPSSHPMTESDEVFDVWKGYFEEVLWEPHGSFEKGAPFLWSACAYTIAATLLDVEADATDAPFGIMNDAWPVALEKELASLSAVAKFARWSFSMVQFTADSKVIYETVKRCCPVERESKREYNKFTKMIGSIDACIRGTILGLLVADTFTAFVVASVVAANTATVAEMVPVFGVADYLQRFLDAFFVQEKLKAVSLYHDVSTLHDSNAVGATSSRVHNTRHQSAASIKTVEVATHKKTLAKLAKWEAKTLDDEHVKGALGLLRRMCELEPLLRLSALGDLKSFTATVADIRASNRLLERRMQLYYCCLVGKDESVVAPSLRQVAQSPKEALATVWQWCVTRKAGQAELGAASQDAQRRCEHADHMSEAYVANMFIIRDQATPLQLIALPTQYDELYSHHVHQVCARCHRVPREPGLCLVCGVLLCCGESCCSYVHQRHGPSIGECTRHAIECGGGLGLVLMLQQCRVVLLGGSMVAYFPCPYVDAHGEEDQGLQRGRPLKLDRSRYALLQTLWRSHRLFPEVSRLRNQRESQQPINLTYI